MPHLVSSSYFGCENDRAIFLRLDFLSVMPDLLLDIASYFFVEANFHLHWLIMDHLEGALHVGLEVEVAGDLEGFVCYVHHLDSVQDEHAYFVS